MKLRILGDSVRLRLSQSDVRAVLDSGRVQEQTHFAPGIQLSYALVRSDEASEVTAHLDGTTIEVRVPAATLQSWGSSDEVSLRAEQAAGDGHTLALLIEKDFKCAVPRAGEEDYDGFENPNVTC